MMIAVTVTAADTRSSTSNVELRSIRLTTDHMIRNSGHLGVGASSEDHDTLRSATARDANVNSTTTVKELADREAIIALYICATVLRYVQRSSVCEKQYLKCSAFSQRAFCNSMALRTTSPLASDDFFTVSF